MTIDNITEKKQMKTLKSDTAKTGLLQHKATGKLATCFSSPTPTFDAIKLAAKNKTINGWLLGW